MAREMMNHNQYEPDYVSPPGDTLDELIADLGMTQSELAERIGRPKKTVNEIVKGKAAITPQTAIQLERVLGVPASFWNNRERNYREYLAGMDERRSLREWVDWLDKIPLKAMTKLRWVDHRKDKVEQLRTTLSFFGVASPERWEALWLHNAQASFRRSPAFESDPWAVSAWLRKGELEAMAIECEPFSGSRFKEALSSIREMTTKPPQVFIPEITRLCAKNGVAVVFVPELPRTRVSGATRWLAPGKALIQLSLRHKTNDHLWFSFFHEAGHILRHSKKEVFIESGDLDDSWEAEANRFASDFLIPPSAYRRLIDMRPWNENQLMRFSQDIGIAPGIVVGRLQHDGRLAHSHFNSLKQRFEWASR